ncbi:MAG: glycosyltransferase family 4 protein [Kiritimatiellia bacterium]
MNKLLVNALSVTNQSGAHVLLGHMGYLLDQLQNDVRLVVLCRADMNALRAPWGGRVDWVFAPVSTRGWLARALWERRHLSRLVRDHNVDAYFTPSGVAAAALSVPQIVFCQNPWALVPAARRLRDAPKAWLQRMAYRRAMQVADAVIFNSRFMQEAYRQNAGCEERLGAIVYQAPGDETQLHAGSWTGITRKPGQIVCASAMGPHKNVETVIRALHRLRLSGCNSASLVLAGGWPDPAYERSIHEMVKTLHLVDHVRFTGFIPREDLDRLLAESQVFCLMSRCESFGIPAIEAQLFGTPVISSNVCAVPEICGDGGWFYDPDDDAGVAEGLGHLLGDAATWQRLSDAARSNARRYSWEQCSPALVEVVKKVLAI